ncbi:hypothetical protein EDB84DRAFT_1467311, partial [Lactarius hengduanensis]
LTCLFLAFPSMPHSHAALTTRIQRVPDPNGRTCKVSSCAQACMTVSDHLRPINPISAPDSAAPARSFITSITISRPAEACETPCDTLRHLHTLQTPREAA